MVFRRFLLGSLLATLLATVASTASGATYRTRNFIVTAANQQVAQQVGQYAEYYRKQKAKYWLGQEMPPWGRPCPLRVSVTMGGSGGATSFVFDKGQILDQQMRIEGKLDRLLASVLPHEITHTVLAYQFRRPVPRWADEGGSVLSEDQLERDRHDKLVRNLLNSRRAMPLRRLFALREYPREVMTLYAQGYSVTDFLVAKKGPRSFLRFISDGMGRNGWDAAVRANYGYRNIEALEESWLQHLARTKKTAPEMVARGSRSRPGWKPPAARQEEPRRRTEVVVRQTVPPIQPMSRSGSPVVRGQSRDSMPPRYQPTSRSRSGDWSNPDGRACPPGGCGTPDCPKCREGYLPPVRNSRSEGGRFLPPTVQIGQPEPLSSSPYPRYGQR